MSDVLRSAVRRGLERADLEVSGDVEIGLLTYLQLLAKWNRKINLTAFDLAAVSDSAIDRLVAEPLLAARVVRRIDRMAVDIGSGGGSPGLPILLACPWLQMVLVEVRQRKAAFLREAIRVLDVSATVEVGLFEDVSAQRGAGSVDVVSMRAVRPDVRLVHGIERVLVDGGAMLWFGDIGHITNHSESLVHESSPATAVHVLRVARSLRPLD